MDKRLSVLKTYKLFLNGKFSRSESGRYYVLKSNDEKELANCCLASRKDFRNAVQAAGKAQDLWVNRSAYNIGQILYRIAENLEGRKVEISELIAKESAIEPQEALNEVEKAIDCFVYFAGWSDKFQQVFSSVNPVASSHFNFSIYEPQGVVAALCDEKTTFMDFTTAIAACICGGNSIVILAPKNRALSALSFAEVLHHSDMPAGVVNVLSGDREELSQHFAKHMGVNSLLLIGSNFPFQEIEQGGSENIKRIIWWDKKSVGQASPYLIKDFMEVKTTWHPIEQIKPGGMTY